MRKVLFAVTMLAMSANIIAQDKVRSVSVELLGAQNMNGFMFRVGVSPSFNFGDKYGLMKSAFYPYIGFGWSF